MLIQPIDIFVYAWLIVAILSATYVGWDQFSGNPEPAGAPIFGVTCICVALTRTNQSFGSKRRPHRESADCTPRR
jgi:hypothetical protein